MSNLERSISASLDLKEEHKFPAMAKKKKSFFGCTSADFVSNSNTISPEIATEMRVGREKSPFYAFKRLFFFRMRVVKSIKCNPQPIISNTPTPDSTPAPALPYKSLVKKPGNCHTAAVNADLCEMCEATGKIVPGEH